MLMELEEDLHHHWHPRVGGQDNVWLDPPHHPVHLVLPLDPDQIRLPFSHSLLCNPCGGGKKANKHKMNASENVPWLLLDVKITRISNHPFNRVIIILCRQKRKHQWTLLWSAELVPEFWLGQHCYNVVTKIQNFCIIFLLCPGCSLDGKCNNRRRIPILCRPNKSMPGVWSVILVVQVQTYVTCLSEKYQKWYTIDALGAIFSISWQFWQFWHF